MSNDKVNSVVKFCYSKACDGYFSLKKIATKIWQYEFYSHILFKDSYVFYKTCENCQMLGSISKKNMMPLNSSLSLKY